jgi:hypothetical protein
MSQNDPDVGPIDYLVVEFPGAKLTGEALAQLVDLSDRGIIRILDLRVAVVRGGGEFAAVALTDLDGDGQLDLAVFSGVESGLLCDDDLAEARSRRGRQWTDPRGRRVRRPPGSRDRLRRLTVTTILGRPGDLGIVTGREPAAQKTCLPAR